MTESPAKPSWKMPILLALATAAALLPFINKPVHLDDPCYLWVADQIRSHPLDFYGFSTNWHLFSAPMHEVTKNPPLSSYYLAAAISLLGRSEPMLHLAQLLPAIGAVVGVYFLARELGSRPTLAAAATLATPVFLVSATTLMCDVPMLCLYIWAIWTWVRGLRTERTGLLIISALLMLAAALTKYFGVTLLPLLAAYALLKIRRPGSWVLALLIPVAGLAAYQLWTRRLYGHGLLLDAFTYPSAARAAHPAARLAKLAMALSFAGGGCAGIVLYQLLRARRTVLVAFLGLLSTTGLLLLVVESFGDHNLYQNHRLQWSFWLQLTLFTSCGVVLAVAAAIQCRDRTAEGWLLLLWILGTLTFAAFLNWTTNGRSVLPLAPAAAIVAFRLIGNEQGIGPILRKWQWAPLIPAAALALLCGWADLSLARSARDAVDQIYARLPPFKVPVIFTGHWGFQWYMEQHGAEPLNFSGTHLWRNDRYVVAGQNSNVFILPPAAVAEQARIERPTLGFLSVLDMDTHAGFYSDLWGPLPFAFGRIRPQWYVLYRVTTDVDLNLKP